MDTSQIEFEIRVFAVLHVREEPLLGFPVSPTGSARKVSGVILFDIRGAPSDVGFDGSIPRLRR
jgi:hypothetical protein